MKARGGPHGTHGWSNTRQHWPNLRRWGLPSAAIRRSTMRPVRMSTFTDAELERYEIACVDFLIAATCAGGRRDAERLHTQLRAWTRSLRSTLSTLSYRQHSCEAQSASSYA